MKCEFIYRNSTVGYVSVKDKTQIFSQTSDTTCSSG